MKKILLLGATGTFGRRLAMRLAHVGDISLVVASRDILKARVVAQDIVAMGAVAAVSPCAADHGKNLPDVLAQEKPWLVVNCSGPFQNSGYSVPALALQAGSHYIDLADARDYLLEFSAALDRLAKAKGLVALAGVSSTPTLSSAVVAELAGDWRRVDAIDMAIAPDGVNAIGKAVASAILTYAGKPIPVYSQGRGDTEPGLCKSRRLAIPGLGNRRVVPAETADADIMPKRFKVQSRVAFFAGLDSALEQRGLQGLALLRRLGLIGSLGPLAGPLAAARALTKVFGRRSGGMMVRVRGLNAANLWTETCWSLLAKDAVGANVPILPIVAATRLLLAGALKAGARIPLGEVSLAAIEKEFQAFPITTMIETETRRDGIFAGAMGSSSFSAMAEPVRDFHSPDGAPVWAGEASVTRGGNVFARLIGKFIGLPPASERVNVRVTVDRDPGSTEIWTRNFGGRSFLSVISLASNGRLHERFGSADFELDVAPNKDGLCLPIRRGWILGIPLPGFLLPNAQAFEFTDQERRFRFDVRIMLPLIGLLAHYRGWLRPVGA